MYLEEELYWHTRSKDKRLQEGDPHTKYFHRVATNRAKKQSIQSMQIGDHICHNRQDIQNHIQEFYKALLGQVTLWLTLMLHFGINKT